MIASNQQTDTTALRVQIRQPDGGWLDVGVIHHAGEVNQFSTFDEYWTQPERPVLGQAIEGSQGRTFSQRVALPNWFSHLLPEGRLREAVASDAGVKAQREFFLLARIGGDDLPGAVRVLPELSNGELRDDAYEDSISEPNGELGAIKFSLAGVQLKFSLTEDDRGLTLPTSGEAGRWIAKLPDPRAGHELVPEVEMAALELARASGISVPETKLIDVRDITGLPGWAAEMGGKAFLIRRFDRQPGEGRVHVEELAQVLQVPTGQKGKYLSANFETVARTTNELCGLESVGEVIDRIVLNTLIGNGDAHAKNWAYVYPDGRNARLSPLYDVLPTVLFVSGDDLGMKLNGSRCFEEVSVWSFDRMAEATGWSPDAARERAALMVHRVRSNWGVLEEHLPSSVVQQLTRRRDALPLSST